MKLETAQARNVLRLFFEFISTPVHRLTIGQKIDAYQRLWWLISGESSLPIEDPKKIESELEDIQAALKNYLDKIMDCYENGATHDLNLFLKLSVVVRVDPTGDLVVWEGGPLKDLILALFAQSLSSVPGVLRLIGRCENCGGWLIRLTRRPKRFCSKHCAAVGMTRERRAKEKAQES